MGVILQRRRLRRRNLGWRRRVRERVWWRSSGAEALRIVGYVEGRRVVLWIGGAGTGGQRGTTVNTSHDRVLLTPIRKYTCYCPSQKRKVTATKLNCRLTPRRVAAVP